MPSFSDRSIQHHVTVWRVGSGVGIELLHHLQNVGHFGPLGLGAAYVLGLKPSFLFLMPVQMPKPC